MDELRERVERRPSSSARTGPTRSSRASPRCSRFLAAEPALARLGMVEAMVAGPVVVERYDEAIQSFVPFFRAGREGALRPTAPP